MCIHLAFVQGGELLKRRYGVQASSKEELLYVKIRERVSLHCAYDYSMHWSVPHVFALYTHNPELLLALRSSGEPPLELVVAMSVIKKTGG